LFSHVLKEIKKSKGVLKAALYYSISKVNDNQLVFDALEELLDMNPESLSKEPFKLLRCMDELNWEGHEILFVNLLRIQNIELAINLCDQLDIHLYNYQPIFDIGSITWWLDWFVEYDKSKGKQWMFLDRVPSVICKYISTEKKKEFISEFNKPNSQYRKVLTQRIIKQIDGLTFDDFTEEAITYLLDDLKRSKLDFWDNSVLADIATEAFVIDHLLPRVKNAKGFEKANLHKLVETIGKNHKRRYLVE
jgi:hypothetical protein